MDPLQILQWLIWNEASKDQVYLDTKGLHTIGIGFLLDDPSNGSPSTRLQNVVDGILGEGRYDQIRNQNSTLEPSEIKGLFEYSLGQAHDAVTSLYAGIDSFSNVQQIILHDLAFNMGYGGLNGFHNMNAIINSPAPDWSQVAGHLQSSLWYRQVGNRGIRNVSALINDALPPIPQSVIDLSLSMQ